MKPKTVSPGVWTVLVLAVLVFLWEGAAAGGHINEFYFSRPSAVWQALRGLAESGTLQKHFLTTVKEAALGLLFGVKDVEHLAVFHHLLNAGRDVLVLRHQRCRACQVMF